MELMMAGVYNGSGGSGVAGGGSVDGGGGSGGGPGGGHGVSTAAPGDPDDSSAVSPVTLAADWSRVARLLLVAGLAVVGSLGNVYMISAVMIEDHLKKRGNTFVVNVALSDLVITGVVMPASAVVILAGVDAPDQWQVCSVQWFLTILSWLVTVLSLSATAAENYCRLCLAPDKYARLTTSRVTLTVLLIWAVGALAATLQSVYDLGPDYCVRRSPGILPYQATVAGVLVVLPTILTAAFYIKTILQVRLAKGHPSFKPPIAFEWDYSLMKTNMYSFLLFFVFWLPFGIILFVGSLKNISSRLFYNLAWFALSKSCINNFLYCLADRHFRNAYINLFHYCCCKTTVTFSRRARGEPARPSGDVRVHIIPGYNMYSYTSPQRARESGGGGGGSGGGGGGAGKVASGKRSAGLRPSRTHSRDVYEL